MLDAEQIRRPFMPERAAPELFRLWDATHSTVNPKFDAQALRVERMTQRYLHPSRLLSIESSASHCFCR
jgi:hypothetical protein